MTLSSLVKNTGFFVAVVFAGQANAGLIGSFSGSVSAVTPLANTLYGDLATDIVADANAPFDLGTLFSGSFTLNEFAIDSNPSPNVGFYSTAVQSFSIAGGDINNTASYGDVLIANDDVVNGQIQDRLRLGALGINQEFVINGNTWVFQFAHIILFQSGLEPSPIFTSDSLNQEISTATPWKWEQVALTFSLKGVKNSKHVARIGSGAPGDLDVEILFTPSQDQTSVSVPAPATLPLLIAALGLLGLRRRRC